MKKVSLTKQSLVNETEKSEVFIMRQAIMLNSNGEGIKMTALEALQSVVKVDPATMQRFVKLNSAIKKNNSSLYEIAYYMEQIDRNKDSVLYGYKTTAEMVESMYGYKKSSTSKMLSVSRNFLTCTADGEIKSKFSDKYSEGYDVPMTCLYELLLDKDTMRLRGDKVIEFYSQFPLAEMKQADFRGLKSSANDLIKSGLPLTSEALKSLTVAESEKEEREKQESEKREKEKHESEKQESEKADSISTFKLYLGTLSTILNDEKNESKKSEMLKMFSDVLNMHQAK